MRIAPGTLKLGSKAPIPQAREFLRRYPGLFGLSDPDSELALQSEHTDRLGFTCVSFTQHLRGVPVFGVELRVHFDGELRLIAVNGQVAPGIASLSSEPAVTSDAAAERCSRDGKPAVIYHFSYCFSNCMSFSLLGNSCRSASFIETMTTSSQR